MTVYPAWTPAPRPGIVPLHPFGFGTTLGRSFQALRQNPAVLLGFALGVQALAYLVVIVVVGVVAFASFSRLDTLTPGSDDWDAVMAGSVALTAVAAFALSLAAGALGVIVQAIVVTEVAGAVVAEKHPLGALWRRVRPVVWRLIGYSFLVTLAVVIVVGVVAGALVALGFVALPAAIALGVLGVLGAIPLWLWLSTKLLLVPATIILEHASIRQALGRSWRLTRRRFWPTLGVIVIISMTFGALAQVVGIPLQFVSMGLTTVVSPTGEPQAGAIIGLVVVGILTQVVTILIQCVAVIVQSTATALIYVDCRMRHEGLDHDLIAYVEQRDAGATDVADPYRAHIGRTVAPRPAPGAYAPPYPGPPSFAGQPPYGAQPAAPAQPPFGAQPPVPPPHAEPVAEPPHPAPAGAPPTPPTPTQWTAPGSAGTP